ncbi:MULTISPECIES: polyamine ABC transporter substrate-binding protein [unclassified Neisseria]|uniref:polyamine ABC transporter substrate-binding protein n=1 Tax=unclassified Neisseria TaxID=2623750 RepID=UPI002664F37F|nr:MULTISPECIES: polyamine ABC transporter substrate-binding protein [unclassified Neisseria]MDO1509160.1 polyamine ABC transporter substrate-binding protein [Neisseria sp. MVDL19-042950]MDO1515561.1 polyamine ABC transporter substrate-binding protein [Neisseria sp. MVDL18-041461]MDO1562920.1 polyamine ABC transporter substrate-binding protein [Neisseria sp. MVDL20-010259]
MNRYLSLLGLIVLALSGCGGRAETQPPNAAQADSLPETRELKIYNWIEYVDPATLADFEKNNNVKITYDEYDSDETLEAKVLTGKSGYDIVAPSNTFVGRQIQSGAYQKLDKSLISNYKHLNPKLMKLMESVDPGNEYAVPFFWGTNTFAINTERVKKALGTDKLPDNQWDLVFNPVYTAKLKKCGISYLDSAAEVYPMVLNYLGKNPNSSNPEDLDAATELLKQNRPNIKRFTSSSFTDDMARGDTCVAIGFGGNLNIAKRRAQEAGGKEKIRVMMPKEGVGIWVDSFTIPKDAKNVLNAHRYIDDFLKPEVAARNGNFVTFAPSSVPAKDLMEAQYRNDNTIFPTDEDLENSFIMVPIEPETLKYMIRQWQEIKAGK